jgi:hypothetical protein
VKIRNQGGGNSKMKCEDDFTFFGKDFFSEKEIKKTAQKFSERYEQKYEQMKIPLEKESDKENEC